jgi:hypothetical protein
MADATLTFLEKEKADLERKHAEYKTAISQISDRLEFIAELRKKIEPSINNATAETNDTEETSDLPPSAAITAFLRQHPRSTRKEIMASVLGRMKTESKSPRDLLRTMIGQMLARKKLKEDGGRISVNDD